MKNLFKKIMKYLSNKKNKEKLFTFENIKKYFLVAIISTLLISIIEFLLIFNNKILDSNIGLFWFGFYLIVIIFISFFILCFYGEKDFFYKIKNIDENKLEILKNTLNKNEDFIIKIIPILLGIFLLNNGFLGSYLDIKENSLNYLLPEKILNYLLLFLFNFIVICYFMNKGFYNYITDKILKLVK